MKILTKIAIAGVLLYAVMCVGLFTVMRQSPDAFSATMSHMPSPALMALPFRSLWMNARSGRLQPGGAAPDFVLENVDHKGQFQLSSLRGQKPAVLVFGSYT